MAVRGRAAEEGKEEAETCFGFLTRGVDERGSGVRTEKWVPVGQGKISSNNRMSEEIRATTAFLLGQRPQRTGADRWGRENSLPR